MKKMIAEFKEFISKGNVMDLAVGMIIGAAFTAIVSSLVDDIIMPIIGMIAGGHGFEEWSVKVGTASLNIGLFLAAIINFLLVAYVLFLIIKAFNKAKSLGKKEEEKEEEPTTKKCPFCKSEIDIEATRCPHCTSQLDA